MMSLDNSTVGFLKGPPLGEDDLCVFVEGISDLNDISKRHRSPIEERVYQAILELNTKPYSEIREFNNERYDLAFVKVPYDEGHSYSKFYLQINLLSGTKRVVRLCLRRQTVRGDGAEWMKETLAHVQKTASTIQTLKENHKLSNGGVKTVTTNVSIPVKSFTQNDLLKA